MKAPGQIIILNGAPRSGKSSIAAIIQETFDGPWMNLGVDAYVRLITPRRLRPGIGLRPGGERPDIEEFIPTFYAALYESIAAHSRLGLNVIADMSHHDSYTISRNILPDCALRLHGLPTFFVGVHCSLEEIMRRRNVSHPGREGKYVKGSAKTPFPAAVVDWQREIHRDILYDMEIDTSTYTPDECAKLIGARLDADDEKPTACQVLALRANSI